jgi:hypothetical protein
MTVPQIDEIHSLRMILSSDIISPKAGTRLTKPIGEAKSHKILTGKVRRPCIQEGLIQCHDPLIARVLNLSHGFDSR